MPGAIHVAYTSLTDRNYMKNEQQLRAVLQERGVNLERPAITSCGSGVTAAVVALALELCGAPPASLYDGSWAEYAQQSAAAIETSDPLQDREKAAGA